MVNIREFLEYNQEVRSRYFEALAKLSSEEFMKNSEAIFHSIRNILILTLNAIDSG